MLKNVSFILTLLLIALCAMPVAAQQSQAANGSTTHVGLPVDWSFRHVLSSNAVNAGFEQAAKQDPRVLYNWLTRNARQGSSTAAPLPAKPFRRLKVPISRALIDWNFTLGAGSVASAMSPAKYTFDANANPTCADGVGTLADFTVYGLNVAGSASQPNLVAFKQLYVNPGGTGFCGAGLTKPVVKFAYNINTLGGSILTSPVLSLDGKKVAFIESSATGSKFHVLTIGTNGSNGTFNAVTNVYAAVAPGASGDDGVLNSTSTIANNVTLSSPWVDYQTDIAYFGDDAGNLYKTTCVFFCAGNPAIAAGWPITVAATTVLTAPVMMTDTSNAQNIFLGGASGTGKGNLYKAALASCPGLSCISSPLLPVGFNATSGGVVDPPIVDSTFQTVFALAGNNSASGNAVVKQYNTALTLLQTVTFSTQHYDVHMPAFTDSYYTNAIGGTLAPVGNMIACGPFNPSGQPGLFVISFTKSAANLSVANPPVMNTTIAQSLNLGGSAHVTCSPITELKNGTTDRIFFSEVNPAQVSSYVVNPDNALPSLPLTAAETGGASGIVIDNTANTTTFPEASSIYFSTLGASATCATGLGGAAVNGNCAVKLTQAALQ